VTVAENIWRRAGGVACIHLASGQSAGRIDFVDPHSAGELVLQVKKRSKKLKADGDGTSKESDGDQPNKETECSGIKRKD
jgi:hypothetical protein